ncbi:hypothetical protein ACJ72_05917 [Emergomyces africanus]|uniref:Zn(2)-C6 fungal-type domain-containing protein n=1 Tax=Emergomyces africanus TaxID=1955775 RepID=A0A1B7NSK7_9EURO|nr:hypothetical protein ACJ72_05917 [Emergomyces africanus]
MSKLIDLLIILDRRISCDRAIPRCTQCARSNRVCQGYQLRLSWPKDNDARRAVVARLLRRGAAPHVSHSLVNASSWDIELHQYLSGVLLPEHALFAQTPLAPFNPVKLSDADANLFQYFQTTASRSLSTLSEDAVDLGNILIRMALASTSPSATAVWQAMMGLSSLHRYGLQDQGIEFKIAAIKALAAASNRHIGAAEAIQHVAAGMLLCSFEIHKASCTSGQWKWYIIGAKQIINSSSLHRFSGDSEISALLDWVYYHDALSRFSALHWRQGRGIRYLPLQICRGADREQTLYCKSLMESGSILQSRQSIVNDLLRLLARGCDTMSKSPDITSPEDKGEYEESMRALGSQIKSLPIGKSSHPTLELFHLATLVYLNRATGNLLEADSQTHYRISRALALLSHEVSCEHQFPLFILGSEARTEEDRRMILDLMARTEGTAASRALFLTEALINHVWVQDDLADRELDYMMKMDAIISTCSVLPSFV